MPINCFRMFTSNSQGKMGSNRESNLEDLCQVGMIPHELCQKRLTFATKRRVEQDGCVYENSTAFGKQF